MEFRLIVFFSFFRRIEFVLLVNSFPVDTMSLSDAFEGSVILVHRIQVIVVCIGLKFAKILIALVGMIFPTKSSKETAVYGVHLVSTIKFVVFHVEE